MCLAAREDAPIAVLIAETGGQNALIADSSALPEQLVKDAIGSAFTSAGQRCSAARVLFVQDDIADKVMTMLAGAMAELKLGDPGALATDVGPVIDTDALDMLKAHATRMDQEARHIATVPMETDLALGTFFAPRAYELSSLSQLQREVFGPVLHVIRWKAEHLDAVIDQGQRHRLRPDPGHPFAHRRDRRADRLAGQGRQRLRQPQPDRRGGRRAAVRRPGPVRHRPQGWRPALPAALRHRENRDGEHNCRRRQRLPAHLGD